jgi:hypothetical protein
MKVNFRQGIVRYGPPLLNVNPTTVDLIASPSTPTIVVFADRSQDYIWIEKNSVPNAWTIVPGIDQWLYWDIDFGTGQRTFGTTTLRPLFGNKAPNQAILPGQAVNIAGVNLTGGPGSNYFEVVGNFTASLPSGKTFTVAGSTNNNGTYTVVSTGSVFFPSANITRIPVNQTIPSDTGTLGSLTTPGSTISNDQHWFDTQNQVMYVFQATGGPGGGRWIKKIRVFACLLSNGAVPISVGADGPALFSGTQAGLNFPVDAGEILFDSETGKPLIRRLTGSEIQFVTSESNLTTPSVFASSLKFNSLTVAAETQEPFAGYMVAKFSDFGKIVHADINTAGNEPFGLVIEDVDTNAYVNVVTSGSVSNPNWNWPTINQYVYCDNTGLLTLTPAFADQVPVGVVLDRRTIFFGIPPGYVRPGGGLQGTGTVTSVGVTGPSQGIGISGSPIVTSGTITLSLTNDLNALEGLTSVGYAVRTGVDTWTTRSITGAAGEITVTNDNAVIADTVLSLSNVGTPVTNSFVKITTDAKGRVTATTPVSSGDITPLVSGNFLPLSGGTMTGSLILDGDPILAFEAATKQYVDALASGLHPKQAVRVATTGSNITLSGLLTIDGVTLSPLDRVLVKDQTNPVNNGIYVASAGAWTRASDFDGTPFGEVESGDFVYVIDGTINGTTSWIVITPNPINVGTTPINWSPFGVGGGAVSSVFGRIGAVVAQDGDYTLTQLADVTITAPSLGQVLKYNGTTWINDTDATGGLTDPGSNGIVVRTALNTTTARTIQGTPSEINVTNGNGILGNPVLQLANVGTPGTYTSVTVDSKGRVTSGTTTQSWSTITSTPTTLSGYGITDAVRNALGTPSITQDIFANRPTAGTSGRLFVDTTNNIIQRDDGSNWVTLGGVGGGTVTSVGISSTGGSITVSGSPITTSGTIDLVVNPANVNHNALQNYVTNEHINHALVFINAGAGLTGGGDLTTTRTLSLTNTGVTPGSYGNGSNVASITVDAQGRITSVTNVPITGGGGGLQRYSVGGGSYVLASGPGVTISITPGNAVINGVPGVEIVSASIYVSSANASGTAFLIDIGQNEGTGDNTSYATASVPNVQAWNDTSGRGLRTTLTANINSGPNLVQLTGLTAGQPFWVKLAF